MNDTYSHFHGEFQNGATCDQTLRSYFPDYDYKGVFVDVGAFDPITISNSYHFERNGWTTYCFEANPDLIPRLKEHRANVYNYAVSDHDKEKVTFNVVTSSNWTAGFSAIKIDPRYIRKWGYSIQEMKTIEVEQRSLDSIIVKEQIPLEHIDILGIDVEGGELAVLKGLDIDKYQPKVILVEDVFNDKDLTDYLISKGYKLDKHISYNKYYLRSDE
jgi:FkbM family methyltransferase